VDINFSPPGEQKRPLNENARERLEGHIGERVGRRVAQDERVRASIKFLNSLSVLYFLPVTAHVKLYALSLCM